MSVRHLSNIPCKTCQSDTLHFALKCKICGTIYIAPSELRLQRSRLMYASLGYDNKKLGRTGAYGFKKNLAGLRASKLAGETNREKMAALPLETLLRGKKREDC